MVLRDAINRQLTQQGLSRYKLAQRMAGRVPSSTIYGFLRGEHPVNSDALGHIMGAVDLTISSTSPTSSRKERAK